MINIVNINGPICTIYSGILSKRKLADFGSLLKVTELRMWFMHALNAKQPIAMRPVRATALKDTISNTPFYRVEITQHALKGQKLLAQGNALGINDIQLTPCKGKSFKIMAQSLSKIYIHLIFHIKSTSPKIRENDLGRLHQYIGKLVKTSGCTEIKAGGIGDHVHVLFILSKDVTISQIVEEIKRNSSRWIKDFDPVYYRFFAWQGGYAAYSISQSVVDKTLQYIDNQKEHHARHSFAEEYKAFLDLYKVEYDEKFVFRD